ncbi:MAG: IS21 family transposase, partial [Gemmatimonadetes bacterium]|nr:IS21 family transposase [Gemmatimonadota bacterium]
VLRQEHKAGEKTFVDYAGQTVPVVDPETGEVREAQIFVGVLGASNFTFAEATWTQSLPDWIASHVRMFNYFGGVSALLIPDNLASAVNKACRYDPEVNPTYRGLATHFGTAVLPTRKAAPRDKAKVENGVLVAERWILAPLRNHTFFSLAELNREIAHLLNILNDRPFQKLDGTRRSLLEIVDRPALKPLPTTRYEYAEWRRPGSTSTTTSPWRTTSTAFPTTSSASRWTCASRPPPWRSCTTANAWPFRHGAGAEGAFLPTHSTGPRPIGNTSNGTPPA